MTPLETLALIFALLILLKMIIVLINPKAWLNLTKSLFNKKPVTALIYFILMIIAGYYVFTSLSIIQISAVMLFTSLLIALAWVPYAQTMMDLRKKVIKQDHILRKNWLTFLIFLIIAMLILKSIF